MKSQKSIKKDKQWLRQGYFAQSHLCLAMLNVWPTSQRPNKGADEMAEPDFEALVPNGRRAASDNKGRDSFGCAGFNLVWKHILGSPALHREIQELGQLDLCCERSGCQ